MKTIFLISQNPDSLKDALSPFAADGFTVHAVPSLDTAIGTLDPKAPPALVVLDARDDAQGTSLRAEAMRLLAHCAFTALTAVTPITAEAFHQRMEGLGMLPPLPPLPSRHDGERLLSALRPFLPAD